MILHSLQDPLAHRLGWALIHFVWQGALVALLLKISLETLRRRSSNIRYLVGCMAMGLLVCTPIMTFLALPDGAGPGKPPVGRMAASNPSAALEHAGAGLPLAVVRVLAGGGEPVDGVRRCVEASLPPLLLMWMAGVLFLSGRLCAGWWRLKRLVYGGRALEVPEWTAALLRASERLRVTRPVKLLECALVEVPAALGWLRPVVLLPASTLSGLTPSQLETILAHELAHIRRHDYLVNLLQSIAETLLFYHPAIWWVSAQIRREREHCCDDVVVAAYGDPVNYARALTTLETLRPVRGSLVVAANGGQLLHRVRRLLGQPASSSCAGVWIIGASLGLAFLIWFIGHRNAFGETQSPVARVDAVPAALTLADDQQITASKVYIIDPKTGAPIALDPESPKLFTRTYKVDPVAFSASIRQALAENDVGQDPGRPDLTSQLRAFMKLAGIDFETNSISGPGAGLPQAHGKALFFNNRTGLLLARATIEELDTIEKALQATRLTPAQVSIDIKFIELGERDIQGIGLDAILDKLGRTSSVVVTNWTGLLARPDTATNGISLLGPGALRGLQKVRPGLLGTLTDPQFRVLLHAIEQRPGTEVLAAPRLTTLSSRQARVEVSEVRNIVTGVTRGEMNVFGTTAIPVGTSVDVIPYVSADGHTIQMTIIPAITSFVGYDDPGPFNVPGDDGLVVQQPLPRFRASQTIISAVVADGETLVLTGFDSPNPVANDTPAAPPKQVLIFITPRIIDSAGNRLHPE